MNTIEIEKISETTFQVTVVSGSTTKHTVTLQNDYYLKLTGGRTDPETLIQKSFKFLLDREPNTSILRSFELPVISRYFPEFEGYIKNLL